MLMEEAVADPRVALEAIKIKEKIMQKLQKMKEDEEEAKRANIIENRITNYYSRSIFIIILNLYYRKISRNSTRVSSEASRTGRNY